MMPGCASGSAESFGYVTLIPSAAGFGQRLFSERAASLILAFSKLSEAERQRVARLFGEVESLADQLGQQVAGATDRGASLIAEQKKVNALLARLLDECKKNPDKFAEACRPLRRRRKPSLWRRLLRRVGLR